MSGTATAAGVQTGPAVAVAGVPTSPAASPLASPLSSPTTESPAKSGRCSSGGPPAVSRCTPRPRTGSAVSAAETTALERERWMRRIQKVKERNDADRERALRVQREQLMRVHETQLRRMRRDHDDDLRRVRQDARSHEDQLRSQLAGAQQLTSPSDLSRLAAEVGRLDVENRRFLQRLLFTQSAAESDRKDGGLTRQKNDENENEPRNNEKPNTSSTRQPMDELRQADETIGDLKRELDMLKVQLSSALPQTSQSTFKPEQVACSGEVAPREARLQLDTAELRSTLQQLRRAHSRERRQLERRIKKMEGDVKSSRLRAKRAVARLRPAPEHGAKMEEKPAILGDTKLPKSPARQIQSPKRQIPSPKRRKATSPPAESDEVVHLRHQVEELQRCITHLRETTQVRRPVQLYVSRPHRLLRGKMSGLPTLKENEQYDSLEDATSADNETSSDISDIQLSDLAELTREELQQLCWQLQRAHQQLRQAHDLLALRIRDPTRPGSRGRARVENELLAAQSLVRDLEAALASKGVDPAALHEKSVLTAQNLRLTQKLRELRSREVKAKHELQELRDMNELLEFRILELEGCQEKSSETSPCEAPPPSSWSSSSSVQEPRHPPDAKTENTGTPAQTLEAAGEDRRHFATPTAAIESAATQQQPQQSQQQPDSLGEERHHWQQKIAALQNTILQLEAALEEANVQHQQQLRLQQERGRQTPSDHQHLKQTQTEELSLQPEQAIPASSPSPAPVSGHQRQPSGNSESELSDYHSDSNDGRPPATSLCACGRVTRPLSSPDSVPLQESGIFDVDSDEKSCQTDVQQSDVSMRELIDLSSEIARLTSVQEQLETSQLEPFQQQLRYHEKESADPLTENVAEATSCQPSPCIAVVCTEVQTDYYHDQLLCDYTNMCDKYQKMKKCKDEVEEEKNELEEAENDARLMVQRLEMKIFASTEVEKMLSSDLAEEQERCRQLQRQLNSVKLRHQADLKSRQASSDSGRAATAERIQELERTVEGLTAQLKASQELALKLTESEDKATETSLVLESQAGTWELWRGTEPSTSDTMSSAEACPSPNSSSLATEPHTDTPATSRTDSLANHMHQAWSFNDSGVGEELPRTADAIDADVTSISAPASSRPAKRPRTDGEEEDVQSVSMATDASMCSECSKRLAEKPEDTAIPLTAVDTTPKNSLDSNLSERENYYSECIQELETEKADIRRRWDEEKTGLLQRVDESCQESCELKQRLDEILQEGDQTKQALTHKVSELRCELRQQASNTERDRDELVASHELKVQTLQEQQVLLRRRLRAAEDVLGALKVELELCQADGGRDSPDVCHTPVLERVRVLQQSQRDLTAQVAELEKKEGAYRETLTEADRIMHNVEMRYQKKIEELEDQLREGKSKVTLMEETEQRLKQALKTSGGGKHDKERITELLDKLIETEHEDLKLKEKVYRLERRERELSIKLREEERASEGLRHELRDQEELLRELDSARRELGAANEQLPALAVLRQRAAELQQSEQFLRGRIEELEQAEMALQETLRGVRTAQSHKERRSAEQVTSLQQELEQLQQQLQEVQLQAGEDAQERCRLRRELQDVHGQLQDVHRDLESTSGSASQAETQFRNEVSKLRNQLTLVNSQLTDNDSYSCQLRDQLEKVQCENCELRTALDGQKSRAEQDIIQLNLEISRREEEISALSEQLAELDKSQLTGELDILAEQESTLVKLLALAKQSNEQIQSCGACTARVDGALRLVVQQLEQLTQLLSGAGMEQSLHSQLRDAEQLASGVVAAQTEAIVAEPAAELAVVTVAAGVQTDAAEDEEHTAAMTQLRTELAAKEEELTLMDGQGSYLQDQLERRDGEARQLRSRLLESDALLDHQRAQHARMSQLLTQTQVERDEAATRADTKDRLIGAVLRHLQAVLEVGQATAIARGLRENADAETDRQDFDREVICQILQQIVATMRDRVLRSRASPNGSPDQAAVASRIPRPVPRSRENTPPCTPQKDVPRAKAPKPRCLQPKRSLRHVPPPVGVARPYRTLASVESRDRVSPRPSKCPAPPLPTPGNFQIIRAVGGDSLLIYWSPPEDQRITGYEIFVNNRLQQVIRNPQRTKALLPSLRLSSQMQLSIRAVGPQEAFSALAWAEFRPGQVSQKPQKATPAAGTAPIYQ